MEQARTAMEEASNRHRLAKEFEEGDQVLLSTKNLKLAGHAKLKQRFAGPFTIIKKLSAVTYTLELPPQWQA